MPPNHRCSICTHPDIAAINHQIREGTPLTQIQGRYKLTDTSLGRHRDRHMSKAAEPMHVDPTDLLADLIAAKERAEGLAYNPELSASEQLQAIREMRQCSEAVAKLSGAYNAIDPKAMMPFWNRVRTTLLTVLERFPEARTAVIEALETAMSEEAA